MVVQSSPRVAPAPTFGPPFSLCNVTTGDTDKVWQIWNDGLPESGTGPGPHDFGLTHDQVLEWITNHQRASRPLWLLSANGRPAALLSFLGLSERPWCHASVELAIHVRHGLRGVGIGRVLIERAVAVAPILGYDRYVACIRSDNLQSKRLFLSCGFVPWGSMPGVMQCMGRRFDLDVYGLVLDKG